MQTFLPVPNYYESARILDHRRLKRQRVEAMQLITTILHGGGWRDHPACRMWRFHVRALMAYHDACVTEWVRRGYPNTMSLYAPRAYVNPPWFGNDDFHSSHRAALLFQSPVWYSQFKWGEIPEMNYAWPEFYN